MITGSFEYRDLSGGPFPGPELLPFFFFSYQVGDTTYESRTDALGNFNLQWANPGDNVTFILYSHNVVISVLDGFGVPIFTAPYSLTVTANNIFNGASVQMTVPAADGPTGEAYLEGALTEAPDLAIFQDTETPPTETPPTETPPTETPPTETPPTETPPTETPPTETPPTETPPTETPPLGTDIPLTDTEMPSDNPNSSLEDTNS